MADDVSIFTLLLVIIDRFKMPFYEYRDSHLREVPSHYRLILKWGSYGKTGAMVGSLQTRLSVVKFTFVICLNEAHLCTCRQIHVVID